jgi:hypothetical protein
LIDKCNRPGRREPAASLPSGSQFPIDLHQLG